jgi:hypothetical protein
MEEGGAVGEDDGGAGDGRATPPRSLPSSSRLPVPHPIFHAAPASARPFFGTPKPYERAAAIFHPNPHQATIVLSSCQCQSTPHRLAPHAATVILPRATAAQYRGATQGTASDRGTSGRRPCRTRPAFALASASPSLPSPNSAHIVEGLLVPNSASSQPPRTCSTGTDVTVTVSSMHRAPAPIKHLHQQVSLFVLGSFFN